MQKKITVLLTCLTSLSVFAAAPPLVFTPNTRPIVVTQKDPTFSLNLPSNPSTGYCWSVKAYPKAMIQVAGHHYVPPKKQKLLGAPGYEVWNFRVLYPTTYRFRVNQVTHVVMQYKRPWVAANVKERAFEIIAKK